MRADTSSEEEEESEQQQHAKHRDTSDPGQDTLVEALVVPALRLLQDRCLVVRYGYAAMDPVQLLKKLLLRHRLRGGIALQLTAPGSGRDPQSKRHKDSTTNRPARTRALHPFPPHSPFPVYV